MSSPGHLGFIKKESSSDSITSEKRQPPKHVPNITAKSSAPIVHAAEINFNWLVIYEQVILKSICVGYYKDPPILPVNNRTKPPPKSEHLSVTKDKRRYMSADVTETRVTL